jgi:HEAT repeat
MVSLYPWYHLDVAKANCEVKFRKGIGSIIPLLIALLNDKRQDVRSSTVFAVTKLADYGEFVAAYYADIANIMPYEVELRKEIGRAIPRLITLLNDRGFGVQPAAISLLTKLADHGEFIVACYLNITNAGMKLSFARKLGRPSFHGSLRC